MTSKKTDRRDFSSYRAHYYPGTEDLQDDEMRVTALGTGMPSLRLSQASACWLVEVPSQTKPHPERFLFDLGAGSMMKYNALQIPADETTKVFLSHLHADHWGDFWAYWIGGIGYRRTVGIEVYGPTGDSLEMGTDFAIRRAVEAMSWDVATRESFFAQDDDLEAESEKENEPVITGDIRSRAIEFAVEAFNVTIHEFASDKRVEVYRDEKNVIVITSWPADHALPGAVSFRLEWNGLTFVYSGDTVPLTGEMKGFKDHFKGADLLVHECFASADSHYDTEGATLAEPIEPFSFHTTPEQFGELMAEYDPRHAVAYHFLNDFDTCLDIYNRVRKSYDGPLTLAKDLLTWNVTPGRIIVRNVACHEDAWVNGRFELPAD